MTVAGASVTSDAVALNTQTMPNSAMAMTIRNSGQSK